uniref:Uncharacterized protein n=1 Tax=Plectus sambesii TaxID=2011161 RepID=A0A914VBX0_9BILA
MGTFTVNYWVKKYIVKQWWIFPLYGSVYYFGQCWREAGMRKARMMKGQSKMFAHKNIPAGADVWKW